MVAERLFILLFWLAVALAIVFASMPNPMPLPGNPSDKLLHALAFFALGLLATLAFPRVRVGILLLGLCALGGAIEIIQGTPYVGRETSWFDWLADLGGAGAVIAIAGIARARSRQSATPSDATDRRL